MSFSNFQTNNPFSASLRDYSRCCPDRSLATRIVHILSFLPSHSLYLFLILPFYIYIYTHLHLHLRLWFRFFVSPFRLVVSRSTHNTFKRRDFNESSPGEAGQDGEEGDEGETRISNGEATDFRSYKSTPTRNYPPFRRQGPSLSSFATGFLP